MFGKMRIWLRGVLRRLSLERGWDFCHRSQVEFFQNVREGCYHPIRLLRLRRIDSSPIPKNTSEILMFMVVRNEEHRLPFLLQDYAKRGVDRFFIVDNSSTDGTIPFLLSQPKTHVFLTKEGYGHSLCGQKWMNILLQRYGAGHWCIVGDADESFIYPEYEKVGLKQLVAYLDDIGADVVNTFVLDMYANVSVGMSVVKPGQPPLSVLRFFDPSSFERFGPPDPLRGGMKYCEGGARKRVLGVSTCLNKTPFIKYHRGVKFEYSCHYLKGGSPADIDGVTLHFKLTSNFNDRVF